MAADPSETIASSLATSLTTASATMVFSFTATVPAKLPQVRRESGALAVQIMPDNTKVHTTTTRAKNQLTEHGVHLITTGEIDATHSRAQYNQLVNEIRSSVQGTSIAGVHFNRFETDVQFDIAHLEEFDQFTSVVRAVYLAIA